METINKFCVLFILLIIVFCIGYQYGNKKNKIESDNSIFIQDTTYNHIVLDSIQYNIIKKDSIIYNLKQEMTNEIKESYSLSDSAAVDLFKWLSTSTDDFPSFTGE